MPRNDSLFYFFSEKMRLEKLKFQEWIEEIITVKRRLRAMSFYQFLLSMVLAISGALRITQLVK